MGVLAADGTDSGLAQGTPSTTQGPTSTALVFDPLTPYPVFPVKPNSASSFSFQNNTNLAVNKIKLKKYNSEGNERGQNDTVISESEYTGSAIEAPATSEDLNLRQLRQSPRSEGNPVLRRKDSSSTLMNFFIFIFLKKLTRTVSLQSMTRLLTFYGNRTCSISPVSHFIWNVNGQILPSQAIVRRKYLLFIPMTMMSRQQTAHTRTRTSRAQRILARSSLQEMNTQRS